MSEFTENNKLRVKNLTNYISGLINEEKGSELLKTFHIQETKFIPLDILYAIDNIMSSVFDIEKVKSTTSKLFNIIYKDFKTHESKDYLKEKFLKILNKDNEGVNEHLKNCREHIKQINKEISPNVLIKLKICFDEVLRFTEHYIVMQNIVFPEIESGIENHACLKIMWSFHDEIIQNIKETIQIIESDSVDLKEFNKVSSKVYFNISTIIFREEYVLFPILFDIFDVEIFEKMLVQLKDFKLEYFDTSKIETKDLKTAENDASTGFIELSTGILSLEQLDMIFQNLPVDITFVDENDEVKYYSDPAHRIFPRTKSIIGRKVQNCHPHESVHVVNKIVEAFKKGEKDEAAFWIKMGEKYVLIKYFAVRNKQKKYKGVLEVSQEISDIQKIKGERRLLDW